MSRKSFRDSFRINHVGTLAGLLATVLSFAVLAAAQSQPYPTYSPGENTSATTGPTYSAPLTNPWVVSDGAIITPAGTQVYLGTTSRAKAIALNPTGNHTAAVLIMGTSGSTGRAVEVFNTLTGAVIQSFEPSGDPDGSTTGITYTPNGDYLLFSQDGNYGASTNGSSSYVAIASVNPSNGELSNYVQLSVPIAANSNGLLSNVTCFSNSPGGTTGSIDIPCGYTYSIVSDGTHTSYPMGIAVSADNSTAYAVLDVNDTLAKINLTGTPSVVAQVRVGNVPHSVVISPNGRTAYVSNEAGRIANRNDFQEYSDGTPVVAEYPTGTTASGTVSVVDLATFTVTGSITTGHHPTGMAFWGNYLLVANAYSDSISVIDTHINQVVQTIDLGLPIGVPGEPQPAYGAGPNSIAVDATKNLAYVALYNANAIAVVDLRSYIPNPVIGMIPTAYAPSSVVLDTTDNALLVANDKGIGSTGFGVNTPPASSAENSYNKYYGVSNFNTHEDLGTASIVPIPNSATLAAMTHQVFQNNHWDLAENIASASGGNRFAGPVAIPAKIGDPSLIKHVFVIIRENRTYDQILGDVVGGNGDPSLAVFGDDSMYQAYTPVTPNAHALVQRFPLLDNFYDPSRQSADGHNWILQAMAPYGDDIQSPDWLRDYPSNGGDALAYQQKGHLFDVAAAAGLKMKIYGEYVEYNTFTVPGCSPSDVVGGYEPGATLPFIASNHCEPNWVQFYQDSQCFEGGPDCGPPGTPGETTLYYQNTVGSVSPLPNVMKHAVQNYPQFDLGIPDQFRVDIWEQDFAKDVANGTVPQLEFMWISSDHTGGPPDATAMEADNDLALGRFVDIISHSPIWSSSAIFVEEDDAQNGVDHVDGHRSPGYIFSPYVTQKVNQDGTGAGVTEVSTFYTQVNMTRTIEQILGLPPMNQNDLVASPMRPLFLDNPPADNFKPWSHVGNGVPLCYGVDITTSSPGTCNLFTTLATARRAVKHQKDSPAVMALRAGWLQKKAEIFAGKYHTPDSEDIDTVSHYDWYEATGFKVPFPGEKTVRPASDFNKPAPTTADLDD